MGTPQLTARDLANIEAEQAVLGALLWDAGDSQPVGHAAIIPPELTALHFYEPFHQRLFQRLEMVSREGRRFDPILSGEAFRGDFAFQELGGPSYLADLLDNAPPTSAVPEYARVVMDLAVKRSLFSLALQITDDVASSEPGEEIASKVATNLSALRTTASTIRFVTAAEAVDSVIDYIDNPDKHASGVLTGIDPLDNALGPLLPGDLVVIGARPSMGKSALAVAITTNIAKYGMGSAEISGEMSVDQLWRRRMTAEAFRLHSEKAPSYSKIRKRTLEFNEREMLVQAGDLLRGLPIVSLKRTGLTPKRLRALAHRQVAAWKQMGITPGALVFDHVGLMKADNGGRSRVEDQTEISGALKEIAGELDMVVIALAQLNRALEARDDKRPTIADLRDSGSWEQDADVVIGLYREAYYAQRETEPDASSTKGSAAWASWDQRRRSPWIDAILLKVREGDLATIRLWANMRTNTVLGEAPDDFFGGLN